MLTPELGSLNTPQDLGILRSSYEGFKGLENLRNYICKHLILKTLKLSMLRKCGLWGYNPTTVWDGYYIHFTAEGNEA